MLTGRNVPVEARIGRPRVRRLLKGTGARFWHDTKDVAWSGDMMFRVIRNRLYDAAWYGPGDPLADDVTVAGTAYDEVVGGRRLVTLPGTTDPEAGTSSVGYLAGPISVSDTAGYAALVVYSRATNPTVDETIMGPTNAGGLGPIIRLKGGGATIETTFRWSGGELPVSTVATVNDGTPQGAAILLRTDGTHLAWSTAAPGGAAPAARIHDTTTSGVLSYGNASDATIPLVGRFYSAIQWHGVAPPSLAKLSIISASIVGRKYA